LPCPIVEADNRLWSLRDSYNNRKDYGVSKQSILKKSRFYWTSKKA
jgi:hypothetical protein